MEGRLRWDKMSTWIRYVGIIHEIHVLNSESCRLLTACCMACNWQGLQQVASRKHVDFSSFDVKVGPHVVLYAFVNGFVHVCISFLY